MDKKSKTAEERMAEDRFPGAAIDKADDDKTTKAEVKERTDVLDFNPHTKGL